MQAALAKLAKAGYKAKTVVVSLQGISCGKTQDTVIVVNDPIIGVDTSKTHSSVYLCADQVDYFLKLRKK